MYADSHIILWPVGTKRHLCLYWRDVEDQFPDLYQKIEKQDYTVFADFEVCQHGPDEPGHMMGACIADMKNAKYFTDEEAKKLHLYNE